MSRGKNIIIIYGSGLGRSLLRLRFVHLRYTGFLALGQDLNSLEGGLLGYFGLRCRSLVRCLLRLHGEVASSSPFLHVCEAVDILLLQLFTPLPHLCESVAVLLSELLGRRPHPLRRRTLELAHLVGRRRRSRGPNRDRGHRGLRVERVSRLLLLHFLIRPGLSLVALIVASDRDS